MPWVLFTKQFDFWLKPRYVLAYKAGKKYLVKQRCADEAIRQGKAEYTERPQKHADLQEQRSSR